MLFLFSIMIYLAPIQGFTDFIYRKTYAEVFPDTAAYFIPYISVKNDVVLKKHLAEILPENNPQNRVVPQVLPANSNELLFLANILSDYGYREINLNLGCPYPMVTHRGKGAGLLPHPERIREMLNVFFEKTTLKFSVKLRAGLTSPTEVEKLAPVFNEFPLTEIIFHPRIATQLYKGEILEDTFNHFSEQINHPLVYNGDIFTLEDFHRKKTLFPETTTWMLGRGILMNPFLPAEIMGSKQPKQIKKEKLIEFHQLVFNGYSETMDNPGNVLNKMKQFWIYFSFNFPNQHKVIKGIKKVKSVQLYLVQSRKIFDSFDAG